MKNILRILFYTVMLLSFCVSVIRNPNIILNFKDYFILNKTHIISVVAKYLIAFIIIKFIESIYDMFFLERAGLKDRFMPFSNTKSHDLKNYNKYTDDKFCKISDCQIENSSVKFSDIAGAEEEKTELQEIVEFLKNPSLFTKSGIRMPKGVLLYGPPGTGKTLFARAIAGEAKVPFFSVSGSDFVEMYVGVGAARMRDLFAKAKRSAPSIIFIDEIDAIGKKRANSSSGSNNECESTLNQLLVEMDGFQKNNVIVIAATNRIDVLDEALLRPGRFDRQITINLPDIEAREAILRLHAKNKTFDRDIDFRKIAKMTQNFSGAQLENLLNEAAISAVRSHKDSITNEDIQEAAYKTTIGLEKKSQTVSEQDKLITAYHEVGHALVANKLSNINDVEIISILPRGNVAGFTLTKNLNTSSHLSKQEILDRICTLLGGRAAESVLCNDVTTGASQDIEEAIDLARKMVTVWGMSDSLGFSGLNRDDISESTKQQIDLSVKQMLDLQYERARHIINNNIESIKNAALVLCKKGKITGDEFEKIIV